MSVFIRKIQRSKNCIKCPCFDDGRLSCKAEGKSLLDEEYYVRRPDWCPIIDVLTEQDLFRRWIPVTERLPKADEYDARGYAVPYLVMNGWMRVTARRTKDYWVLFGNGTVLEYVTHWMSLPEPPKEE